MSGTMESEAAAGRAALLWRLGIGVVQGVALYWLFKQLKADQPWVEGLRMAAMLAPLVLLADIKRLPLRWLALWFVGAATLVYGLGVWAVYRSVDQAQFVNSGAGLLIIPFLAILLFIAHHLVAASLETRRWLAPYPVYFDSAWRHALQVELGLLFLAIFWAVLWLGAALFELIGQSFLEDLIKRDWVWIPVSAIVFAGSVHLTDVRIGLVRGFRSLVLTLFSALLPLVVAISAVFLVLGAATGLKGVWTAQSATGVLLGVAVAQVLFLNAAYQGGDQDRSPGPLMRWIMRVTPFLVLALALLCGYALIVLVNRHGWSPSRIVATCACVVILGYGIGYGLAVLSPGRFMARLEPTNVLASCLALLLGLALLSPIADPSRLSVEDQVHRLLAGQIKPDRFDWNFLATRSDRFGQEALQTLRRSPDRAIAQAAQKDSNTPAPSLLTTHEIREHVQVYPVGAALPAGVLDYVHKDTRDFALPGCLYGAGTCSAYVLDLNHDGRPDVVVAQNGQVAALVATTGGAWVYYTAFCRGAEAALKTGPVRVIAPEIGDLDLGQGHVRMNRAFGSQNGPEPCQ
jgi:hypothetical protein